MCVLFKKKKKRVGIRAQRGHKGLVLWGPWWHRHHLYL